MVYLPIFICSFQKIWDPKILSMTVLCSNCGIQSDDLQICIRCKRPIKHPKITTTAATKVVSTTSGIPTATTNVTKTVTSFGSKDFYGNNKIGGGPRKSQEKKPGNINTKQKGRGRGKSKNFEEPVILTISSDEEDNNEKNGNNDHGKSLSSRSSISRDELIHDKEPIITPDMDDSEDEIESSAVGGGGIPDINTVKEDDLKGFFTTIACRTIRIGSYKVIPTERVLLAPQGIRITIPHKDTSEKESAVINIPRKSILKMLAQLGKNVPALFIYLRPSICVNIRRILKMSDKNDESFYFDSSSTDDSQKRIILMLEKINDEIRAMIKSLYGSNGKNTSQDSVKSISGLQNSSFLEELNSKEANEILVRLSPRELSQMMRNSSKPPITQETKRLLIYPPPPQKGGISITTDDYCCLEEEQFLNDVIIDFYLK